MSEAEASGDESGGRKQVWIEKYRPDGLDEVVGHEDIIGRIRSYVEQDDIPHLMFAGPAGTGKCVTGETPVLTNRGVERIDDVVGDVDGFGEPDDGLEVLTFGDDGTFEYVAPSKVFGKEADELVTVNTRDGNEFSVTPEHRLLTLSTDGLAWQEAGNLSAGDRVVRPRATPSIDGGSTLDWTSAVDSDRIYAYISSDLADEYGLTGAEEYVGVKRQVFRAYANGESREWVVETTDLDPDTVAKYWQEAAESLDQGAATRVSLATLFEHGVTAAEGRQSVDRVEYVNANNYRSEPITVPDEVTPDLAKLVGLAVSEARIDNGRIRFYNTDENLLDEFERILVETFDLEPTRGEQGGTPFVRVISETLTHFLRSCFDVFESSVGGDGIGSTIVTAPEDARTAFLRAMFDAEGYVTKQGTIELTQKNADHITLVSYLLAGLGIPSRRKTERKAATNGSGEKSTYHTLSVSGAPSLRRFEEEVGFSLGYKADRLAEHAAKEGNPNYDTMPTQAAVDTLCDRLHIDKNSAVPESLNPESPGRESYEAAMGQVLSTATERLEAAQTATEQVAALRQDLQEITKTPATWVGSRRQLEPIETRKAVASETGVRTDRLLEYADGRRAPTARRTEEILVHLGDAETVPPVERVQTELAGLVDDLGVSFERLAAETDLRGNDVSNLLRNDDHDLASLSRFAAVADAIECVATEMCSMEVVEALSTLDVLVGDNLYYDEVASVERTDADERVYDLTVPESHNYIAGEVPTVMHNTATAVSIAKEVYGDDWRENFLELNASDQRGIDVVRDRIKNFARSSFGGYDYRIIFLDEADALCVPPGTEVVTGYPSSPEVKNIEDVAEDGEPIPSVDFETNEVQSDKGKLVDSGVADFFELELDDGRTVLASLSHPFFVVGDDGALVEKELQELKPGDEIADFQDDIGVSRCEICGQWTTGRFCSLSCKDEGHSLEMRGEGNPMYGTEWSDERREKIVNALSDGRLAGENNPNHGGTFHGISIWEMDEERIEQFRKKISEKRSGTSWDEWVVDADPDAVKEQIGRASAEWWEELDEDEKERIIRKATENCEYPVVDITGDNNPMRDPEVAQKVSEALKGHEPTGGNVRHSDELGHLVRSDWEYEVAKALQDADVDYEYEPAFELSDSVYHPDFLIGNTVVEVKGVAALWGQTEKVEEFLETYGDDYTFVVVGDEELPHHEHYERDEFDPALVSDGGVRTVQTAEVRNIEYSHRGKAYNISMEGTPNFMLGNGILTHNTSDAQSALRRTMEQFSNNTRFILSCNYSSQIIDPIQSRCAVFRFSPLSDEAVAEQIRYIAGEEGIEYTEDGVDALVYAADGDMRKAINALQAASVMGDTVDEETVYAITSTARPEEVEAMVTDALNGDFVAARAKLDELLTERGLAGGDIVDQIHRSAWEFDLEEQAAVRLLDRLGEADYRITTGANERVQLEALLASLALE